MVIIYLILKKQFWEIQSSAVIEKPKAKVEEKYDDAFEEIIIDDDEEE